MERGVVHGGVSCGVAVPRAHLQTGGRNLEGGPEGDDTGWVLGSPRSPHKRPSLDTPSGLESDHISHPADKHFVYGSP